MFINNIVFRQNFKLIYLKVYKHAASFLFLLFSFFFFLFLKNLLEYSLLGKQL